MGLLSLFRRSEPVTEAAPVTRAKLPERSGFEYGISPSGLNEWDQGMGAATQTDRRTLMGELYESYLACPWSWAAVNAIARTITAGGLQTDWDQDDGEGDQEQPDKPPGVLALERLFKFVNPREDIRQLLRGVISDLLVFGDAYIEIVSVGSQPVALYSLDSPTTSPICDEHGTVTGYVQVTEFGQRADFSPDEVIHISLDSPRSGVFGVSPTQAALLPITGWLFAATCLKETYRKGNPPTVHVDMPQGMGQSEMNKWTAQHMTRFVGARNIGFPMVTRGGAHVQELQHARVVEMIDTLNQKRDEILASYGCPPAEAGVIESGNLGAGTGESQRKTFIVNTCQPIAALLLEKLDFALLKRGFGVTGWHLKFAEVDMRDSETIEKIRDMRLRNGSWSLNRYKVEIGEPAVDGGDDPVLVERQVIVKWRDVDAYSKAAIAALLKGSTVDMAEPGDEDTPVKLNHSGTTAPLPAAPPPTAGPPDADTTGEQGNESVRARACLGVSESWRRNYERRRDRALAELPSGRRA